MYKNENEEDPVYCKCIVCKGHGWYPDRAGGPHIDCGECNGTGKIIIKSLVDEGVMTGEEAMRIFSLLKNPVPNPKKDKMIDDAVKMFPNPEMGTNFNDSAMRLEAKKDSWEWFFDTMFNNKNIVERTDGKSLGNFWAIVQHLQEQFERDC